VSTFTNTSVLKDKSLDDYPCLALQENYRRRRSFVPAVHESPSMIPSPSFDPWDSDEY